MEKIVLIREHKGKTPPQTVFQAVLIIKAYTNLAMQKAEYLKTIYRYEDGNALIDEKITPNWAKNVPCKNQRIQSNFLKSQTS